MLGDGSASLTGALTVADEAYDADGWASNLTVPTKKAVRDKIESLMLQPDDGGDPDTGTGGASSFVGLSDTPNEYVRDDRRKLLRVGLFSDKIEFASVGDIITKPSFTQTVSTADDYIRNIPTALRNGDFFTSAQASKSIVERKFGNRLCNETANIVNGAGTFTIRCITLAPTATSIVSRDEDNDWVVTGSIALTETGMGDATEISKIEVGHTTYPPATPTVYSYETIFEGSATVGRKF